MSPITRQNNFRRPVSAFVLVVMAASLVPLMSELHAQPSLLAREGTLRTRGVRLYYKRLGSGEPIVVVHGGPGINHSYFLPQMGELAQAHQLIFFDQRAHGRSSSPRDTNAMMMEDFVEDLEAIRLRLVKGPMNLLAHSWGSTVALRYAARYPENLKTLILVNPTAVNDSLLAVAVRIQSDRMTDEEKRKLESIRNSRSFERKTQATMDRYFRILFRPTMHDAASADSMTLYFPRDYSAKSRMLAHLGRDTTTLRLTELKRISSPTLIVHGEADPTPLEAVVMIRDSIPGAVLTTIPKSGHFPFLEQTETFTRAVQQFLNQPH